MFNLPWYAWVNLLGLPILLLVLYADYALRGLPKWTRYIAKFQLLCCAATLVAYRNTHLIDIGYPVAIIFFIGVSSLFALQLLDLATALYLGIFGKKYTPSNQSNDQAHLATNAATVDLDAELVDLDQGCCAHEKRVHDNMPVVLNKKLSGQERLKGTLRLLGELEEGQELHQMKGATRDALLAGSVMLSFLIAPFLQGLKLIGLA